MEDTNGGICIDFTMVAVLHRLAEESRHDGPSIHELIQLVSFSRKMEPGKWSKLAMDSESPQADDFPTCEKLGFPGQPCLIPARMSPSFFGLLKLRALFVFLANSHAGQIPTESLNTMFVLLKYPLVMVKSYGPFVWGSSRALPTSSTAWKFQCRTTWTNGSFLSPGGSCHGKSAKKWMIWGGAHPWPH